MSYQIWGHLVPVGFGGPEDRLDIWRTPRRYWSETRGLYLKTYLSDVCRECQRRIWVTEAEIDIYGETLLFCKDCIIRMMLTRETGEALGSRRPWRQGLITQHIADFIHPTLDPRTVRRRIFEASWLIFLSLARPMKLGYSDVYTIADLGLTGNRTRKKRIAVLDTFRRVRNIVTRQLTVLEIIIQYL